MDMDEEYVMALVMLAAYEEMQRYGGLESIPCGCPACDEGVQPGHFACSQSPAIMVIFEDLGLFARESYNNSWRWICLIEEDR